MYDRYVDMCKHIDRRLPEEDTEIQKFITLYYSISRLPHRAH